MKQLLQIVLTLLFAFALSLNVQAQSKKQKDLELKRQRYVKELQQINTLLFSDKKKEKSVVSMVEDLNYKVSVRKNLIEITNDQANLLVREINNNQKEISSLRDQLQQLKEDYAAMVVKSYKSRSEQSRVMFLLSSDNFKQAYKRLQYLQQYTDYQKKQGEDIKLKSELLQQKNKALLKQKEDKQKLVEANRIEKKKLESERIQHETLMASIRKNMSGYAAQIKKKKQEIDAIDKAIQAEIRKAIAASNKKKGVKSSSSKTFALTPEGKALAKNFEANKGKLPWPVLTGIVTTKFGKQPSPIDRTTTIQSNGLRITTSEGSKVRAVFEGEVLAIIGSKNSNPTVLIRHGNYISAYKNLAKVKVKKGQNVSTKQELGEVFTDKISGKTILRFSIFKNQTPQNPAYWIAK
ncbi:MAG: peptidase M23 [Bacteroidetes bacterium MedPE-SWsnd-G2]|nr:MAG: peptidase M23 [Bacteroidetes bacterium MedPE-SWsnd-G2]